MEAMALRHGEDLIIPNCNMANDGYIQPGIDASLPAFAQAEIIASPLGFADGRSWRRWRSATART